MSPRKILIIDGLNTFYRSYVVNPSLSSKGLPFGGCKGFLSQLQKLGREISPDEIIIVWDSEEGSKFRKTLDKSYKDGRKPLKLNRAYDLLSNEEVEENKAWQFIRLIEYLNKMPVRQLKIDHVEADDVISMIARHPEFKDDRKIILSNDKDFYQLLDKMTIIWRPVTKQYYTINNLIEEYAVSPQNFALARAVVGDSSDNLPGVKGVGFKTLVKGFPELSGSADVFLDELLEKASQDPEKAVNRKLVESRETVEHNYKMMQLYAPHIPANSAAIIKDVITDKDYSFEEAEIQVMMLEDGIAHNRWGGLNAAMRAIRSANEG